MALARGFKTRCENISRSIRADLGRRPYDQVSAAELAAYLDVRLIAPRDIHGMTEWELRILLKDEREDWSAATICVGGLTLVIYNSANSLARRESDISHELGHVVLRHTPSTLAFAPDGTWALRDYDERHEEEAAWLSGCLLLPRPALLRVATMGLSVAEAAARYGVSERLLVYRKDVTGVTRQVESMRAARSRR